MTDEILPAQPALPTEQPQPQSSVEIIPQLPPDVIEKSKAMIDKASELLDKLEQTNSEEDALYYSEEDGYKKLILQKDTEVGRYITSLISHEGSSKIRLDQRLNKIGEGSTARIIRLEFSPNTPLVGKLRRFEYDVFENALVDAFEPKRLTDEQAVRAQKTILSGLDKRLGWVEHQGEDFVDNQLNEILGLPQEHTESEVAQSRVGGEVAELLSDSNEGQ